MTTPTNSDYINAINILPAATSTPYGFKSLYYQSNPDDGFSAIALGNMSTKQIIVAFLGPLTVANALSAGARTEDDAILNGNPPEQYIAEIVSFANNAMQEINSKYSEYSTSTSNVFVTGNSLGGYAAEIASQIGGYGGAAFGAPGIPNNTGNPSPANFTVYVAPSDVIANYADDSNASALLTRSGNQYHYGNVVYLGPSSEIESFRSVIKDFASPPVAIDPTLEGFSKILDLAYLASHVVSEHVLTYYQHNIPDSVDPNSAALDAQPQIEAESISDDSLDLLAISDIFMGGGVTIDDDATAITVNPDQTLSVSVTSTDGTRSGISSYDVNDNLQGGAAVGPQWDELFGVLPDFSESSKQILVDQGSTVTVTGSSNTLYVSVVAPLQETITTYLTLTGDDDTVASTNSGDFVTVSGANDTIVNQGVTNTFSSIESAPVTALGDTSIFEAVAPWSGVTTEPADDYSIINIKVIEQDGSYLTSFHETVSNGSSSASPSYTSILLFGSNGLEYESAPVFRDGAVGNTINAYGSNGDVAIANYSSRDGGSTSSLASVNSSSTTGDWSSASLSFIYDTHSASSIYVSGSFGSDEYYVDGDGNPTEVFRNSQNTETESISTGTFTDPSTGDPVTGTEVTTFSGNTSTTTVYKSGDSNAPTFQFPSDAPTSYGSAADLWSQYISSTMSEGSSSSATPSTLHAATSISRPITPRPAELALAPSHANFWHSPLIHPA